MNKELLEYIKKHSDRRDKNLKYDFMPSLLEIIERPAHAAGRVIIWTIVSIIFFTIMWAYFSKVEVIISAKGSLEPVNEPDIVSAKANYKIISVNVEEGQIVKEGELLADLSAEEQEKERNNLETQVKAVTNLIELYNKILADEDISSVDLSVYEKSEKADIQEIIDNYNANKKMMQQYINSNFVSQAEELNEEYKKEVMDALTKEELKIDEIKESIEELNEDISGSKVYAPYDGVVYKLYIDKENIVVSENQPIVSVVKLDSALEMKCYVSNTDVADIELNQKVNIKLDAYLYSEYGTVNGIVTFISEKAEVVDGVGKAVLIKVSMEDKKFDEKLLIGLSGNAEMVVNKRRIIDYFLEPITGALKESIREK